MIRQNCGFGRFSFVSAIQGSEWQTTCMAVNGTYYYMHDSTVCMCSSWLIESKHGLVMNSGVIVVVV